MTKKQNTRQINPFAKLDKSAETYTERDWLDSEISNGITYECLRVKQPARKTFFQRFGFRTYGEMLNCERVGD